MKCIKRTDGTIVRVEDAKARKEVTSGKAEYTSKKEWKEAGRARE